MIMSSIQSRKIKGIAYIAVCLLGIGEASCRDDSANEGTKRGFLEKRGRGADKRVRDAKEAVGDTKEALGETAGQAKKALDEKKTQVTGAVGDAKEALVDKADQAKQALDEKKTQISGAVGDAKEAARTRASKTRRSAGKALSNLRKGSKSKLNESCQAIVKQLRSQADAMETQCQKLESDEE